jgi:hypothetical protein
LTFLKGIVLCLVLANVGYFLWEHGIATPDAQVAARPAILKLASEAPHAGGAPTVPGIPSVPAGAPTAPSAAPTAAPPGPGAVAAGASPAGIVAGPAAAGAAVAVDAPPSQAAELLTNVKRCISVGPFRDVSEAAHAAGTLRGGGYDPRQRVADGEVWAGVWVYLPLPAARLAADKTLEKLTAGGIDDALEMPGPNDASVISLGLYGDSKRAEARVAQAQALGFNPALADRKRNGNVYWIDIDLKPTDSLLNPSDLQSDAGRIVRLQVKACPPAASPQP